MFYRKALLAKLTETVVALSSCASDSTHSNLQLLKAIKMQVESYSFLFSKNQSKATTTTPLLPSIRLW